LRGKNTKLKKTAPLETQRKRRDGKMEMGSGGGGVTFWGG